MLSDNMKKVLTKSTVNGAVLAAAGSVLYGNGAINVMGTNLPAIVPLFGTGFLASAANEYVHQQLGTPSISTSYLIGDYTSLGVSAATAGALTVGIMSAGVGLPSSNYLGAFGLGAASVVGTDLIEKRFLEQGGKLIF
jgi:hypothetical protein